MKKRRTSSFWSHAVFRRGSRVQAALAFLMSAVLMFGYGGLLSAASTLAQADEVQAAIEALDEETAEGAAVSADGVSDQADADGGDAENASPKAASVESADSGDAGDENSDADANALVSAGEADNDETTTASGEGKSRADGTFVYEDNDVKATVSATKAGAIPDVAELVVTPVTDDANGYDYDAYLDALDEQNDEDKAVKHGETNTLLYDVALIDEDGTEVQPKSGRLDVEIEFKDAQLTEDLGVKNADDVHVTALPLKASVLEDADTVKDADDLKASDIKVKELDANAKATDNAESVSFEMKTGSVVGIVYTVDFLHGGYEYSIPGGSSILLSDLFKQLGINVNAADVCDVAFTSPELVQVGQEGSDWRLTSLQPFTSDETLVATLNTGEAYVVQVTDEQQIAFDRDSTVHVSFVNQDGAVPDGQLEGNYYLLLTLTADFQSSSGGYASETLLSYSQVTSAELQSGYECDTAKFNSGYLSDSNWTMSNGKLDVSFVRGDNNGAMYWAGDRSVQLQPGDDLGDFKYLNRQITNDGVAFTLQEKDKIDISVNFTGYDGGGAETFEAPRVNNNPTNYYIRIKATGPNNEQYYAVKKIEIDGKCNGSVSVKGLAKSDEALVSKETPNTYAYDSTQFTITDVRLINDEGIWDALNTYEDACSADSTVKGFKFKSNNAVVENKKYELTLEKWDGAKLEVDLNFNPAAGTTLDANGKYWLRVAVNHRTTGTTYFLKQLDLKSTNTVVDVDKWLDNNANPSSSDFTGNETGIIVGIYKEAPGRYVKESDLTSLQNAVSLIPSGSIIGEYKLSDLSAGKSIQELKSSSGGQGHVDRYVYELQFDKVADPDQFMSAKDILGDAINFGIVTESFVLNGKDAETNVAALVGKCLNQTGNDKTNPEEQTFLIAEVDDVFKVKGFDAYVVTPAEEVSKFVALENVKFTFDTSKTKQEIQQSVNAMLNAAASKSAEFVSKSDSASVVVGDTACTVDITGRPAGTYYVTVNDELYKEIMRENLHLHISKNANQVIVLNVTASSETVAQHPLTQYDVNGSASGTHVDTDNDLWTETVVWNFTSASNLSIGGSIAGIVFAPNATVTTDSTSAGWLIAKNVNIESGEWHNLNQKIEKLRSGSSAFFRANKNVGSARANQAHDGFAFVLEEKGADGSWKRIGDSVSNYGSNYGSVVVFPRVDYNESNFTSNSSTQTYVYRMSELDSPSTINGTTYRNDATQYFAKVAVTKVETTSEGSTTVSYVASEPKYYTDESCTQAINEVPVFVNEVTGSTESGSLKIVKNVTVNSNATTGTEADGTYEFVVKDANGSTAKTVDDVNVETVHITIRE